MFGSTTRKNKLLTLGLGVTISIVPTIAAQPLPATPVAQPAGICGGQALGYEALDFAIVRAALASHAK